VEEADRGNWQPCGAADGRKEAFQAGEEGWIRTRVAEKPDITGRELLAELHQCGVEVSYYGVWHFLDHAGLSFKKNSARQRTGPHRRRSAAPAMETASG
jgi:transposase